MRRSLLALILVPLLMGTTINGSFTGTGTIILGTQAVGDSFVRLQDSSWGTGAARAEDDLTELIAPVKPPPWQGSTAGYSTDSAYAATTSCTTGTTIAAVQTTINSICAVDQQEDTILILPNCSMAEESDSSITGLSIPQDCDGLHLQGQENTVLKMDVTSSFPTAASSGEHNRAFIEIVGNADQATELAECDWTAGFAMGDTVLTTDCDLATSGSGSWPVGSLVMVDIDNFSDHGSGTGGTPNFFRIAAVDTTPSAADTITIDSPLTMHYNPSGADPYVFDLTGHRVVLVERKGSGVSDGTSTTCSAAYGGDSDCWPERISFADITLETADRARYIHGGTYGDVRSHRAFEIAFDNVRMGAGGAAKFSLGRKNTRTVVKHSRLDGPVWQTVCYATIVSISDDNPAVVTTQDDGDCAPNGDPNFNTGNNPAMWISSEVAGEATLVGRFHDVISYTDLGSTMETVIDLDRSGESPIGAGEYASVMDGYAVATVYADSKQIHFVDNIFKNSRVGYLIQSHDATAVGGAHASALIYNYFLTDLTEQCSRDLFFHGSPSSAGHLFEGNHFTCNAAIAASSPAGEPQCEGVNITFLRNWLNGNGTGTAFNGNSNFADQRGRGLINNNERGNVDAECASQYWQIIANRMSGIDPSDAGLALDFHNNPSQTAGFIDMYVGKNLFGENVDNQFSTTNTTTERPDGVDVGSGLNVYGASADIDEATTFPAGWSTWVFPSSAYYDDPADRADWVDGVPPWGCVESGPFPWQGVDVHDGTPPKSPAQIRYEIEEGLGGTCTPP